MGWGRRGKAKARGGKRRVEGEMNGLEARFAAHLRKSLNNGEIKEYRFEEVTLTLTHACKATGTRAMRYTPDFRVVHSDDSIAYYECKGYMQEDAWLKLKMAAERFPLEAFVVVRSEDGQWVFSEV